MLYAGPPDAQIEETHLAHVPDPRQNLPGQEGSREPSPFALLNQAAAAVRRTLAASPASLDQLRKHRAKLTREIERLVMAIAAGDSTPSRILADEVKKREEEQVRLDRELAQREQRASLGNLDVARALRELQPVLASWKETLHGQPARAREVLRKLIVGPIVMEPLPEVQGYRWTGKLNGGAVLEGEQKYLTCRGSGTHVVHTVRKGQT